MATKKQKFKIGDHVLLKGVIHADHGEGDFDILFDGDTYPTELTADNLKKMERFEPPLTFSVRQIAFVDQLQAIDKKTVLAQMRKRKEK